MLTAASIGASAAPAYAQGDVAVRDAQARFEEGLERVKVGDFEAARLSFAQAYTVLRRPAILWNLALAEEKTGHLVDALSHFKVVARDATAAPGDRDVAQRHAAALMDRTGHIAVDAPSGAVLTVDGDPTESVAPLAEPLDVAPGHHAVEARLGRGHKTLEVDAAAGQVARLTFAVADDAPPGAAPTPAPPPPIEPGAPGPAEAGVDHRSSSPSTARIVTTSVLGGAALVAAGVGVFLALRSHSDASDAANTRSTIESTTLLPGGAMPPSGYHGFCSQSAPAAQCVALQQKINAQNTEAIASDVLYASAGVLAVGAIVTWFVFPKRTSEPSAAASGWVAPAVSPTQVGLTAGGSF